MSDRQRGPRQWLHTPWVIGVGSSVIVWLITLALPSIGSELLTLSSYVWKGAIDSAYQGAVVANLVTLPLLPGLLAFVFANIAVVVLALRDYSSYIRLKTWQQSLFVFGIGPLIPLIGLAIIFLRSTTAAETYERRMMALTPAFSEQERKALIGAWGHVMSKADFDALMAQMEELATKYGITLPARQDQ